MRSLIRSPGSCVVTARGRAVTAHNDDPEIGFGEIIERGTRVPSYEQDAAALLTERVLSFLATR